MSGPRFTILLPIHRPPHLLPFAIRSVLAQSCDSFELFVICDGAPAATAACAHALAAGNPRIKVFEFEKGERYGEAHRHRALSSAMGAYVAQIGDDDLWFPDHLAELGRLLDDVDFGNLLQVNLRPDGTAHLFRGDLCDPEIRRLMLTTAWNCFGPSAAGYRLAAYRKIPVGWSPAPADVWTDLHMWRKFLACGTLRFGTRFTVQGVKLSAGDRIHATIEEREAEQRLLEERFRDATARSDFVQQVLPESARLGLEMRRMVVNHDALAACLESAAVEAAATKAELEARLRDMALRAEAAETALDRILASSSWRVTGPLRRLRRLFRDAG